MPYMAMLHYFGAAVRYYLCALNIYFVHSGLLCPFSVGHYVPPVGF